MDFQLGFGEPPFSVNYDATNWKGADTTDATSCPNGQEPDPVTGCQNEMSQADPSQTPIPPACSPSGEDSCEKAFSTLVGNGTPGYGKNQVNAPGDVIVETGTGAVFFCDTDNYVVRKIIPGRTSEIFAGNRTKGDSGDGGPAVHASLSEPVGLALGPDGSVYIADRGANRVRVVTPEGTIEAVAGDGTACDDPKDHCGDGGEAIKAHLTAPSGVWADPLGNVYIADSDDHKIRVVKVYGTIHTVAGTGIPCADPTSGCGDGDEALDAQLNHPTGIVGDGLGNIYIADTNDNKVRKLSASNRITTVFGTGAAGYNGNINPWTSLPRKGTDAEMKLPQGLAVDTGGNLFVADTGNSQIRTLSTEGDVALTAGKTNVSDTATIAGWNGDGLWANQTELNGPVGIAVTERGQFVTTDTINQRVRAFGPYPPATESTSIR